MDIVRSGKPSSSDCSAMRAQERRWRARSLMGVYAAVRREPERGVGAVLRPFTASITGSQRGSDVLVTIPDRPGAMVTRVGGGERR